MVRSSVTMDLEEQFHSVKHAIWELYPTGSKMRVLEQRPDILVRPSWRVSYLAHRDEQLTSRRYRQVVDWTIDYYGLTRVDVMDSINTFEKSIKQGGARFRLVNLIPAWRFEWQYPPVVVSSIQVADGNVAPATYQVRVGAVDACDNESAASVAQAVVVVDNAIRVRIPRVPYSSPLFKQFKIYVNGSLEGVVDLPYRQGLLYPQIVIKDLLGTGAAPLEPGATVRVRWQNLRVTGWASSSREDDIKNGVFTGNISLQTTVEQEHDRVQLPTIERVDIDTTLNVSDRFTITVGVD